METDIDTIDLSLNQDIEEVIDPITDIIDYLVRCSRVSFKSAHVNEAEIKTKDKINLALDLYKQSPTKFLAQFGKYLAPYHVNFFENLQPPVEEKLEYSQALAYWKCYHTEETKRKRIRNRRFKALQKLQNESDYFSDKQMMFRNPLLYEQLVGQFLTDDEIHERDGVDSENITFLNMILDTVDRNQMRETKNEQMLEEEVKESDSPTDENKPSNLSKRWGDFDVPDTKPSFTPEVRKQAMISAPEKKLLREEFLQEMYSSFIDGNDADVDYNSIDDDEQYDDLQQASQDAEDRYFDSETNEVENLEEHMKLVQEYGSAMSTSNDDDPLDVFMKHITIKHDNY